jgi:hypothetical protein
MCETSNMPASRRTAVVFLDLRTIVERHLPAAEIDHSGAAPAVALVEDSFLHRINP